jgi:SAM-dependent methyltransferase
MYLTGRKTRMCVWLKCMWFVWLQGRLGLADHWKMINMGWRNRLCVGLLALAGVLTPPVFAQEPTRATSTPYAGDLSIFETPGREERLQIDRVMDLLKIVPGKSVADLGAGSGWFTVRAARRVGVSGRVFAEDINPEAIQAIDKRAQDEKLSNIKTILGTPDDTKLPAGSVDAVLLLKVYHEIAHPVPVMQQVRVALRPDARVGIIDRNGNGTDHGLDQAVVVKEMGQAGYRLVGKYDFTKADGQDYFLIFSAK